MFEGQGPTAGQRTIAPILLLLFFVNTAGVVLAGYYYVQSLDEQAEGNTARLVSTALRVDESAARALVEEYSFWDETHEMAILERDASWIEKNIGQYLVDRYGFDFTMTVLQDHAITNLSSNNAFSMAHYRELLNNGLGKLLQEALKSPTITKVLSGYVRAGDVVYRLTLAPLVGEDTQLVHEPLAYLVVGARVSKLLTKIGDQYKIPGLRMLVPMETGAGKMQLEDLDYNALARITWVAANPGRSVMTDLVLVASPFFIITLVLTWFILAKDQANRSLNEEHLYRLATRDGLTGLNNRRHFLEIAQQEFTVHLRNDRAISVLMLDLDHFKRIKDGYGHRTGDRALRHFASVCSMGLRATDVFGRLGGEEFAIVLAGARAEQAELVAERVRELVEQSTPSEDGRVPAMTVSIGVAAAQKEPMVEVVMQHADQALSLAKRAGRNRVEVYQPDADTRQ